MKHLFIASILSLSAISVARVPDDKNDTASGKTAFAVVELFTSEGCSSCPPADKLLSELADDARDRNLPLFALSFHVDYWNYLGWTDPFSDKRYSERQRRYAQSFRSSRIYTPQMVINGKHEFVGSNRGKAESLIRKTLQEEPQLTLNLNIELDKQKLVVEYGLDQVQNGAVLNVALVERDLSIGIKRGENSGRTLHHDNVVRAFETVELQSAKGQVKLDIPGDVNQAKSAVVAYVQNRESMEILGVAGRELVLRF